MALLTVTPTAKGVIEEYSLEPQHGQQDDQSGSGLDVQALSQLQIGSPIEHHQLVALSKVLVGRSKVRSDEAGGARYRLDNILRGAKLYQPPPLPKKEPTPEYKALMKRLREQEEQRQYERMLNPPAPTDKFGFRNSSTGNAFHPATSHGALASDEVDDITYADINRQMILIINILISIICCSVFIWIAARRWSVPQRLGLSLTGSTVVAVAEVGIYFGYIKRLQDAKTKEAKKIESKEIVETWVIDKAAPTSKISSRKADSSNLRYRKATHQ
ncbi:hypothetical protein KC356_g1060 [Hortaea werneckii]|nr:hypothetical protein KC356_g1060 [Hortaea werneckii]